MVQRVLIFCHICLNIVGLVKSKTTVISPRIQPVYLKSGGSLDLLCQQSDGFKVVWLKLDHQASAGYRPLDSSRENGFLTLAHVDGVYNMRLIKEGVNASDSGSYKCTVQSGTDMPFLVDVYVLRVEGRDGLVTHSGNTTSIGCSLLELDIKATIRWFKSGLEVASGSPVMMGMTTPVSNLALRPKYHANTTLTDAGTESTLTIRNIGEADVGEYTCVVELNEDNRFNHSVFLYSYPQIKSLGRSVNLAEGKALDLNCKAWGWPAPNVTWSRNPEGEGHPQSSSSSSSSSSSFESWVDERVSFPTNTSLRISPVVSGDRAVYVCQASSVINDTLGLVTAVASVLVRVRGKFAPLLPLAGILVEVFVLFIVIFFYERKRSAEREEQERTEAVGNQSNSVVQGPRLSTASEAGGRHRKFR